MCSLILKHTDKTKENFLLQYAPADLITIILSELPKNSKIAQITQITGEFACANLGFPAIADKAAAFCQPEVQMGVQ
jgi:hypothetical protein